MHAAALLLLLASLPLGLPWNNWDSGNPLSTPPARAEHSLTFFNDTAYVFGGRGNAVSVAHDPRTFSTERVGGTVVFTSYSQKHVMPCLDANGYEQSVKGLNASAYQACYNTTTSLQLNDVWSYSLNCSRSGQGGCAGGWTLLVPGALLGGCRNYNDAVHCSHPLERYGHAAAILYETPPINLPQSRTLPAHLLIYGGASQLCVDYCTDMWSLNLTQCSLNATAAAGCLWKEVGSFDSAGPGKRWRAGSAHDNTRWAMFGGHRLWHGMAKGNSAANNWSDFSVLPFGGFLDDLWVYTWQKGGLGSSVYGGAFNNGTGYAAQYGAVPDPSRGTAGASAAREISLGPPISAQRCSVGDSSCSRAGAWQQVLPRQECFSQPGAAYAQRNALGCTTHWPRARAQAALALSGETLYLYGGFTVAAYPYPYVHASGSGDGTIALKSDGIFPYPSQPQFLGDLWAFDFRSGLWRALGGRDAAAGAPLPPPLRGHALTFAGAALILSGGYSGGAFNSDLWLYNISIDHWLRQNVYPHPRFAPTCTSDFVPPAPGDPLPLRAAPVPGRTPPTFSPSALLEVTAGQKTDGLYGRVAAPTFMPVKRRATYGWQGCTARADGRTDLPDVVSLAPSGRAYHGAVWSEREGLLLTFGGEVAGSAAVGETWAWSRYWCPSQCHTYGACVWGHCYCAAGFYGLDCSNRTCPGSVCRYDTDNHEQQCMHCCSEGWLHADGEGYVTGIRKVPCSFERPGRGEMNGVCDGGTGTCACAPPYLGDDCSIKDCRAVVTAATPVPVPGQDPPEACSGPAAGQCSVEYPVSRCLCNYPYTGDVCQSQLCLNNCSPPRGACDSATGLCTCATLVNPYNQAQNWSRYAGDDCSWVPAFAGAGAAGVGWGVAVAAGLLAVAVAWGA